MRPGPSSVNHETWLQLGSLGVWGVYSTEEMTKYRTTQINIHFRGINIGIQSILFLSRLLAAAAPASWLYTPSGSGSQVPGQIFSQFSYLLFRRKRINSRRARCVPAAHRNPSFLGFHKGVWEFQEFEQRAPGARPLIHRLSTSYPLGSLGSLKLPKPMG